MISIVPFVLPDQFAIAQEIQIPVWIKNQIKSWSDKQASDSDFVDLLGDLNKQGLIKTHSMTKSQNVYLLPKYGQTIFIKIAGRTGDFEQTSPVTLIVVDPKGQRSEYTIPVLESSAYSTVVPISHNSPIGTYTVFVYHTNRELPTSYFYVKADPQIPWWIKDMAKWLAEERISDRDFVLSMQYLIDKKIIDLGFISSTDQDMVFDVSVDGLKVVRRGTVQSLDVHVSNMAGPVDGATVFVRVEDYGENILEEFTGVTNSSGNYSLSWELSIDEFNDIETLLVYVDVTDGASSKTKLFTFEVYCLCGEPNCKCRN
jgi:hypothetical protein